MNRDTRPRFTQTSLSATALLNEPCLTIAEDRPLRIALFSGNYNCIADGANRALNRLVGYLREEKGAEVRVYSPVVKTPAFAPVGTLVGVPSIPIPGRSEYRLALGLPLQVRRDITSFQPDIFHLSAPDWLGRAAQKMARESGVPIVASLHTRFETYLQYYGLRCLQPPLERYLLSFYHSSDCVLAPNALIAAELKTAGIKQVDIWSRGVDPHVFSPAFRDQSWRRSKGYSDDDAVILFFGRIVREKGIAAFVDVLDALRDRGRQIRPLIVGDGPARKWMEKRLPEAHFTGHLSGDALSRAVASADILFNPSITEAFGNVVLEAMASGLSVVSADAASARSLIDHERSGFLVPPGIDDYAAAIERLLDSPPLRREMSAHALLKAEQFLWPAVLEHVVHVYAHALGYPL